MRCSLPCPARVHAGPGPGAAAPRLAGFAAAAARLALALALAHLEVRGHLAAVSELEEDLVLVGQDDKVGAGPDAGAVEHALAQLLEVVRRHALGVRQHDRHVLRHAHLRVRVRAWTGGAIRGAARVGAAARAQAACGQGWRQTHVAFQTCMAAENILCAANMQRAESSPSLHSFIAPAAFQGACLVSTLAACLSPQRLQSAPPLSTRAPPSVRPRLPYLQVGVRADDGAAGEVHALAAEVAPEAALLALEALHKAPARTHARAPGYMHASVPNHRSPSCAARPVETQNHEQAVYCPPPSLSTLRIGCLENSSLTTCTELYLWPSYDMRSRSICPMA